MCRLRNLGTQLHEMGAQERFAGRTGHIGEGRRDQPRPDPEVSLDRRSRVARLKSGNSGQQRARNAVPTSPSDSTTVTTTAADRTNCDVALKRAAGGLDPVDAPYAREHLEHLSLDLY